MHHYPADLRIKRLTEFVCIFPDPVNADKNIPWNGSRFFRIRKRDHIGKIVPVQVGFVQFKNVQIIAENIIDIPGFLLFRLNDRKKPGSDPGFIGQSESNVFGEKLNFLIKSYPFFEIVLVLLKYFRRLRILLRVVSLLMLDMSKSISTRFPLSLKTTLSDSERIR